VIGPKKKGFTLIELMIVIAIISIIAAIAIPNMMAARKHGNEANAIGALKTIVTAETMFNSKDADHDGNLDYGMLSELNNTDLIDPVLGAGTKAGYIFQAAYSYTTSEWMWFCVANPLLPQQSADRYFSTNQGGAIFYTSAQQLLLDTSTCLLPNNGVSPVGK
jgi:prepilin-type N-terminal cleavage/methylation domain-containing protein